MKSTDLKPNHRILIVDDNRSIHNDFREILCPDNSDEAAVGEMEGVLFDEDKSAPVQAGFELDSAYQGQEALEMVKKALGDNRPYAVAFVDVRMPPGWDGVETIARIWEADPELQIIVCTAYADYSWEEMRAKVGQPDSLLVLKKPFDNIEVQQLAHAMTKKWLLNHQSALQIAELAQDVVERTRAESTLQKQFTRISLLNQITHAISERQDTGSILHVVLRQLEDHTSVDLGCVALFDAEADTLNLAAMRVKNPLLVSKLDLHEGAVLKFAEAGIPLCKEGQTIYAPDTLKQPAELIERLAGAGLRSLVAVPLLVENKLFGVLFVAQLKPDGFSSGDCEFLRMLCEHVALAVHQSRLHTELEQAYNELRQTQQAVMQQERLKALGQMASGIAHDVNNALSPVVGFADLMLRGEHGLSANGKKYLKHIQTAGEDIVHIIARLREFYRRREDRESLQKLNLNALAEQVVDLTRPRWRDIPQSCGITVEVQTDFAPDVPKLAGIESEVREALTNLVLNAADALPRGGKIIIRTYVPRCESSADGKKFPMHVVLEVSDTGIGMNEVTRKRCLEPFFSTKGKGGTGLGLAMVYGVMERHEGKIEIQSEPGKGTTIRLIFPIRKIDRNGVDLEENNIAIDPLQILCIDDEPLLRELLKQLLEQDGHHVEVSDGGQSGLDAFRLARERGAPFDLVFTDLGMPYVDGRQVAKTLKDESPATPIVMLTGWGAFMKEDDTLPSQVDGVLSKPPRSREIRETLRRIAAEQNGHHKNCKVERQSLLAVNA
jgi:signal transduction histidine kinase/DNA-binding response OmpR family regulator